MDTPCMGDKEQGEVENIQSFWAQVIRWQKWLTNMEILFAS